MSAEQAVQIAGAVLVLTGFVLAQFGRLDPDSPRYLWLNLLGASALAVVAAMGNDLGFLLLEGVWAVVSAWSLLRLSRSSA